MFDLSARKIVKNMNLRIGVGQKMVRPVRAYEAGSSEYQKERVTERVEDESFMFLCHKTSGRELMKRLFGVVVCVLRFQPCHKFGDSLAERYLGRVSKGAGDF